MIPSFEQRCSVGHRACPQLGGGGGASRSSNDTTNNDKRVVVDGGLGVSGDNNILTVTDGGIVSRALDTVDIANALGAKNINQLFTLGGELIGKTQSAVAGAYASAHETKAGALDNKTIIVLAVVVVVAAIAFSRAGK